MDVVELIAVLRSPPKSQKVVASERSMDVRTGGGGCCCCWCCSGQSRSQPKLNRHATLEDHHNATMTVCGQLRTWSDALSRLTLEGSEGHLRCPCPCPCCCCCCWCFRLCSPHSQLELLSGRQTCVKTNEPAELLRSVWFKDLNDSYLLPSDGWRRPGVDIRTVVCLVGVEGKRRSPRVGLFTHLQGSHEGRATCSLPNDDLWQASAFRVRRAL